MGSARRVAVRMRRLAVDHGDLLDRVAGQAVRPRQQPVSAAHDMAGDADSRTAFRPAAPSLRRQRLIDMEQRGPAADRDKALGLVDGDIGHPPEVDHDIARLRKAFVGMAAAADREK